MQEFSDKNIRKKEFATSGGVHHLDCNCCLSKKGAVNEKGGNRRKAAERKIRYNDIKELFPFLYQTREVLFVFWRL